MESATEAPSNQLQVQLLAALNAQLQQPELDLNLLFGLFSAVLKEGSATGAGSVAQLRQVFQVLRSESYQPDNYITGLHWRSGVGSSQST